MTLDAVRHIIISKIGLRIDPDGWLVSTDETKGRYVFWDGDAEIKLDGMFMLEELEALWIWAKAHQE